MERLQRGIAELRQAQVSIAVAAVLVALLSRFKLVGLSDWSQIQDIAGKISDFGRKLNFIAPLAHEVAEGLVEVY